MEREWLRLVQGQEEWFQLGGLVQAYVLDVRDELAYVSDELAYELDILVYVLDELACVLDVLD